LFPQTVHAFEFYALPYAQDRWRTFTLLKVPTAGLKDAPGRTLNETQSETLADPTRRLTPVTMSKRTAVAGGGLPHTLVGSALGLNRRTGPGECVARRQEPPPATAVLANACRDVLRGLGATFHEVRINE